MWTQSLKPRKGDGGAAQLHAQEGDACRSEPTPTLGLLERTICYRLVLRPVKAMLDRNFSCTVTEYVLAPCSIRKPRAKSVYASRARVHTDQGNLW